MAKVAASARPFSSFSLKISVSWFRPPDLPFRFFPTNYFSPVLNGVYFLLTTFFLNPTRSLVTPADHLFVKDLCRCLKFFTFLLLCKVPPSRLTVGPFGYPIASSLASPSQSGSAFPFIFFLSPLRSMFFLNRVVDSSCSINLSLPLPFSLFFPFYGPSPRCSLLRVAFLGRQYSLTPPAPLWRSRHWS